jgi:hypothetical protein
MARIVSIAQAQDIVDALFTEARKCSTQGYHQDANALENMANHLDLLVVDAQNDGEDVALDEELDLHADALGF